MYQRFSFTVAEEYSDETAETLYGIADDATYGSCEGKVSIDFDREAETLDAAIKSAAKNVRDAGLTITGLHMDSDDVEAFTCHAPA